MIYENYYFWGMHLIWWIIWIALLFWIFAIPYDIPGQRNKINKPLDMMKKRYASGQINKAEYEEKKKLLET